MARSISDEEIKLRGKARRRLVGAIALVVIVTAFLPMVLDNQPKPMRQDIAIDIPKPESGSFSAPITPLPAAKATAPQDAAATPAAAVKAPLPAKSSETPAPATPPAAEPPQPKAPPKTESTPKTEAKATPKTEAEAVPKPDAIAEKPAQKAAAAHGAKEGFVVQLGAFSQAANAKQLQTKLKQADIKSFTDVLKTASGEKTRVRAGPFGSREEAEKAQAKLKKMGLTGNVVSAN
ncbi:MAG: SPOR domain-containing protein [Sulfuricellaceae bacterium]|nr:SPOR domain-containing protein [Sulfuricellaceae bacterium]